MPMEPLYKQQFVTALNKYQSIKQFKDDMFEYKGSYFFIVDNGGEINVSKVGDDRLPISVPINVDGWDVSPIALCIGVGRACNLFLSRQPIKYQELREHGAWFVKLFDWLEWVKKYNSYWDHETDGSGI
jgi:hypothetical protein